jgi:hypothetical protein
MAVIVKQPKIVVSPHADNSGRPRPARRKVMDQRENLSALIADIYDATLDPACWPDALGKARNFVGGVSASLFSKDAARIYGGVFYSDGGLDQHYVDLYFDKYIKMDPTTTGHYFAELEEPVGTADLVPYDEFVETRFYKEWAKPQGLVDFASALLDKTSTTAAFFGVFRHERDGVVDDAARGRMRLIAPHIRRAVLIANVIELRTAHAETLADTLDGLSAGIFLIDDGGRIVHATRQVAPCLLQVMFSRLGAAASAPRTVRQMKPCARSSPPPAKAMPRSGPEASR